MPEQCHKHRPRINSAPCQCLYIQYRVFFRSMSHRTSAIQELAQRLRNRANPKKRHPLNGSCSPVRCDNSVLTQQTRGSDPPLRQCCNDVEDAVPTLQQHRTKASSSPESDTCDTISRLTAIVSHAQYKSTNRTHLCRTAYL